MDISEIRMSNLFLQLGLEADDAAIAQFITEHQLPAEVHIVDAPYWNQGQRSFLRETMSTGSVIHKVLTGTGDCGTVDWTFLGLSMPGWSLLWFVLLGLFFLVAGFSRRTRARR